MLVRWCHWPPVRHTQSCIDRHNVTKETGQEEKPDTCLDVVRMKTMLYDSLDDVSQLIEALGDVGTGVPQGLVFGHCRF